VNYYISVRQSAGIRIVIIDVGPVVGQLPLAWAGSATACHHLRYLCSSQAQTVKSTCSQTHVLLTGLCHTYTWRWHGQAFTE